MHEHHSPITSTWSPSSKSASPISVSGSILSPSTLSAGTFTAAALPLSRPVAGAAIIYSAASPAFLRNARTIAPHLVEGRTSSEMSLTVLAERTIRWNVLDSSSFSFWTGADAAPPLESLSESSMDFERAREGDRRNASPSAAGAIEGERMRLYSWRYWYVVFSNASVNSGELGTGSAFPDLTYLALLRPRYQCCEGLKTGRLVCPRSRRPSSRLGCSQDQQPD